MTQKEQITEVFNAFTKIANINDYFESFSNGNLKMASSKGKIEITITKPKSEPYPEFLNVNIMNNSKKLELDIYTEILVDICNRLGLMDEKLQMKFDFLTNKKAQTIIIDGKEYKLA